MISFYILPRRLFLRHERLSDTRVSSIAKKEYNFAVYFFAKIHKGFKDNI